MRILYICATYMQLITAIQMKLTIAADKEADIVMTDVSVNAQTVAKQVESCGLFSRVLFLPVRHLEKQSNIADLWDVIELTFGLNGTYKKLLWADIAYDEIFYFNPDPWLYALYDESRKNGGASHIFRFEEGVFSCKMLSTFLCSGRAMAIHRLRRLLHKVSFFDKREGFFCFYPELLTPTDLPSYRIPLLSRENKELILILNQVFSYDQTLDKYPQKFIFFGSSSDIDGRPVGETELVLRIADMVGKENLLVKMHPRDRRDVYEKYGIAVSRNSAIPWEVIQLNNDFADHVFLTVSSGSVVNASAMLGDMIPTYFLYPMVKGKNTDMDKICSDVLETTVNALQKIPAQEGESLLQKVCFLNDFEQFSECFG